MRVRRMLPAALAVGLLTLAGCAPVDTSHPGPPRLVATTNVYADLARAIGGDDVQVTALIDTPNRDPHEFQPSARDELAVARADLVVVNGGGYDDFADRMVAAAPQPRPQVIDVARLSGHAAARDFNEHLWYDVPTMRTLVTRLGEALGASDPAHADGYTRRADALADELGRLIRREARLAQRWQGTPVAVTEPLPAYLVAALHLHDRTPAAFSEAVEDDVDATPAVLHALRDRVESGDVAALLRNTQADGPQVRLLVEAARRAGVPVVDLTETLPRGEHYVEWMGGVLDRIDTALEEAAR